MAGLILWHRPERVKQRVLPPIAPIPRARDRAKGLSGAKSATAIAFPEESSVHPAGWCVAAPKGRSKQILEREPTSHETTAESGLGQVRENQVLSQVLA